MKSHFWPCALGLFLAAFSCTPACAAGDALDKPEAPRAVAGGNENITAQLKGFVVSATLKQSIGNFSCYSQIAIGDRFELDLDHLPVKALELIPAKPDAERHSLPFRAPLQIDRAYRWTGEKTSVIEISEAANATAPRECRILVVAQSLEKGSTVWVRIYVGGGFIGSMAQAEGVLK